MVRGAKPDYIKRLGIIFVVRLRANISTHTACEPWDCPRFYRPIGRPASPILDRVIGFLFTDPGGLLFGVPVSDIYSITGKADPTVANWIKRFIPSALPACFAHTASPRGQMSGRRSCLEIFPSVAESIASANLWPMRFFFLDSLIEACATPAAFASLVSEPNLLIAASISSVTVFII